MRGPESHFDRAITLYDPAAHRPLAALFGQDNNVAALTFRSWALWLLGYPDTALADVEYALKHAREIGQAGTLMYALTLASWIPILCGKYAAANAHSDEAVALAEEKGALMWKALGTVPRGHVLALTGKASDSVQVINAGITAWQSTGSTFWMPWYLSNLAEAHAELDQFNEAWRCIGEAMTAVETTKERLVRGRGLSHCRGNRAEVAGARCGESGSVLRARPRSRPPTTSQILGTPRRHEPRAPLARPGQGAASARTAWLRFTGGSRRGSTRAI